MDIIKHGHLSFLISLLWMKGLIDGSDVTQTDILWEKQDEDATMSCNHTKAADYIQMYWYRQRPGESIKLIVFTTTSNTNHDFGNFPKNKFAATKTKTESGTFTVKNLKPEDKGLYFCAVSRRARNEPAYFGPGTKLTVLENGLEITRPTVKVLRPSPKECRNDKDDAKKKTIVCVASGFYPDHVGVFWEIDREIVTAGVATDEAALREGNNYTITSRLRVSAKDWFTPTKTFTCTVSFYNGTHTELYSESIEGEEAKGEAMTREKYLKITQSAKLSYAVFIAKSSIYGAFVAFLVWKLQKSAGKQN